jgi:hypothetical protein
MEKIHSVTTSYDVILTRKIGGWQIVVMLAGRHRKALPWGIVSTYYVRDPPKNIIL